MVPIKKKLRITALPHPVHFCMLNSHLVGQFLSSLTWVLQVRIFLLLFLYMLLLQKEKLASPVHHNSNIPSQIGKQPIQILSIVVITTESKRGPGI